MKMGLFDSGVPYQRMINVSGGVQRYRMMRYVMVLGIVLVTIFLYVSYYTTPMSAVDSRYLVSQEPREQLLGGGSSSSSVVDSGQYANTIVLVANVSSTGPREQQQQIVPEEGVGGVPSEATKSSSNSNSNNDGASNKTNEGDRGGGGVSGGGTRGSQPTANKEEVKRIDVKTNLTDLERRSKDNMSIIIPKVETPPKQDVLAKLPNVTRPAVTSSVMKAKNKLTGEVYEPGFMDTNPDLCPNSGENIRLLALVHSAPSHTEARYAIRQTWGHFGTRRDIAIGFLVGRTSNATWEANLASEQFMYGDIVRSNSFDSYDNLTLKTISMLEWADTYCGLAKFLLKVDDDMFINVPKLLEFTQSHWNDTRHIYGRLAKKWRPIRNRKSKYYVSPALYAPKNFPDFVTGPSYLLTTDILREMFEASLTHAFLKLEDVYMTGIVSEMVGVKRKHVNEFLNRRIAFNPCSIRKAISIHMVKGKEQFDLWKKLLDVDLKCK